MNRILLILTLFACVHACACASEPESVDVGTSEQAYGAPLALNAIPSVLGFCSYVPGQWPGVKYSTLSGWQGYACLLPDRLPVYEASIPLLGSGLTATEHADAITAYNTAINAIYANSGGAIYFADAYAAGVQPDFYFAPTSTNTGSGDWETHLHDFDGRYTARGRCGDSTGTQIRLASPSPNGNRGVCTRNFYSYLYVRQIRERYDEYAAAWCLNISWAQYLAAHVTHSIMHYLGYAEAGAGTDNITSDLEPQSYSPPSSGCPNGKMNWGPNVRNLTFGLTSLVTYYQSNNAILPE